MAKEKKTRRRPTRAKLKAAAPHVAHDVRRLGESFERRHDAFAYTSWYSFCRSVMDFMESKTTDADDVHAADYFDDPAEWDAILAGAETPQSYSGFRKAVNKLAAHLTYSRAKYEGDDKFAPSAEITDYLVGLAQVFYLRLPEDRKLWFGRFFR